MVADCHNTSLVAEHFERLLQSFAEHIQFTIDFNADALKNPRDAFYLVFAVYDRFHGIAQLKGGFNGTPINNLACYLAAKALFPVKIGRASCRESAWCREGGGSAK